MYLHVDDAIVFKCDLTDSVFIQSSLREIGNHLSLLFKECTDWAHFYRWPVIYKRFDVAGHHNVPTKIGIPSFVKEM